MMERLLELGVDINSMDDAQGRGIVGLHLITLPQSEEWSFLLEKDADPQIKNLWGRTPLDQAGKYYKLDVVEFFKGAM